MGTSMTVDPGSTDDLPRRAGAGDRHALAALFARYRGRLRRMVRLRLDCRLQARVDPSDVLQESQPEITSRAAEYAADPQVPPFLGLRLITGRRLAAFHRRHLVAQMRSARQEAPNSMDPLDREVLTLRHSKELTNAEVAQVLGLSRTAASNRYIRALEGAPEALVGISGLLAP